MIRSTRLVNMSPSAPWLMVCRSRIALQGDNQKAGSSPGSPSHDAADSQLTTTATGGSITSLERRELEAAEKKGSTFGFMRRQEFDSHTWMLKNFAQAETLPSGIKVFNLPPAPKDGHDFEMYQKTTSDFISPVNPNTLTGVGLGAGFGSRPDKRLGWLRPKKDHLTPVPPEEDEKRIMAQIHRDGIQDVPEAKTPEERKQQIERMLQYMKSYDGTSLSGQEHFLLVDLDYERDSLLFGNTREDFIQNVEKLKQVILQYNKWERTDNIYHYATLFFKFASLWLIVDCVQTFYRFRVLRDSLDDFAEMTHEEIEALKEKRILDVEKVRNEIVMNPPDFSPVVQTILEERRKARSEEALRSAAAAKEASDLSSAQTLLAETVAVALSERQPTQQEAERRTTTQERMSSKAHPMDTTFEEEAKRKEEADQQHRDMQQFAKLSSVGDQKSGNKAIGFVKSLFGRGSSKGASAPSNDSTTPVLNEPLTQADYARFSYAAAPTSINTVRAIRRLMLPRSDDFTQMVREEMLEYKSLKDASTEYR